MQQDYYPISEKQSGFIIFSVIIIPLDGSDKQADFWFIHMTHGGKQCI